MSNSQWNKKRRLRQKIYRNLIQENVQYDMKALAKKYRMTTNKQRGWRGECGAKICDINPLGFQNH